MSRRSTWWSARIAAGALLAGLWVGPPALGQSTQRSAAMGPLRVHPDNPRYFADAGGRAVLLAGAHTWNNLVDIGPTDPPAAFDFDAYLDFLCTHGHNVIRLWTWESTSWDTRTDGRRRQHTVRPHPWARTGPGEALDGKPRFDLSTFDPDYFKRLRTRVAAARQRGIYVSIMLFEGWAMQFSAGAWRTHPFHPSNTVNGLDGDADGDGNGLEIHELGHDAVTRVQEAYVRKVIETVNDLDNVLYEISNENHPVSTEWQVHMIDLVHRVEKAMPAQHPVGMTFQFRGGSNQTLFDSPAEWVSPNPDGGYRDDPPPADGRKVVLNDTDHLWGIGGNRVWVWKSFLRGHHPLFMDPYDGRVLGRRFDKRWAPIHRALGQVLAVCRRVDLAALTPQPTLASTGFCLAGPARKLREVLVYAPDGGAVSVDLCAATGEWAAEWFSPHSAKWHPAGLVEPAARRTLTAPFKGDALLHLRTTNGL